jgi:DNA helicase-2/ATP-dependent DNA helicase PcrA
MTTLDLGTKNLTDDLNPQQREAVLCTDGPLLILAGAGTGKTRVITYRIAHLLNKGVPPREILAVTFTNKAAGEMKKRVASLAPMQCRDVWLSTFHSFAAQLLRIESKNIGLRQDFVIYDDTDQKNLVKECIKDLNLDDKKYNTGLCLETISRAKDDLIDAESYVIYSLTTEDPFRKSIANLYSLYQKRLTQNNALDFGDLLLKAVEMLRTNKQIAAKYQSRFNYVMIDEYQDTNHAQHMLTKILVSGHKNICVVGDDDQSIYSWRGAKVRNILDFEKEFKDTKIVKLEQNYRSTQNILNCAWGVIKNNQYRKEKRLWTEKTLGDEIPLQQCENEQEEAAFVINNIIDATENKGLDYNDIAVFYRTNAQSRVFEEFLRKVKIPYKIIGAMMFYERMEIKDIMAYLKIIVNPRDSISLKRVINVPHRNIGDKTVQVLDDIAKDRNVSLWEILNEVDSIETMPLRAKSAITSFVRLITKTVGARDEIFSLSEYVSHVLKQTEYIEFLDAQASFESKERIKNLQEFVSAVSEYEQYTESPTLETFLTTISLATSVDNYVPDDKYVTLMTIHMAKGLEFPTVFMTGLEEGLFPLAQTYLDENPEELEEERRLCYVGMTRAKEKLFLTYANTRRLYGKVRNNIPSRFLYEAQKIIALPSARPALNISQPNEWSVGDRVRHAEFGDGKIVDVAGSTEDMKVTVMFRNGKWKKLYVKYANLEKL